MIDVADPPPPHANRRAAAWAVAGLLPAFVAAAIVFGWRGGGAMAMVVIAALFGALVWQRVGLRGRLIDLATVLLHAVLLAALLPPDLFGGRGWPLLATAGLLLPAWTWAVGGAGVGRPHPVLLAFVTLWMAVAIGPRQVDLTPRQALERQHALVGDLLDASWRPPTIQAAPPWQQRPPASHHDAVRMEPAASNLLAYTTGRQSGWMDLGGLLRERMPSLYDLVMLGQPSVLGAASGAGVLLGGLVLIYARRQALLPAVLAIAVAYLTLLVLPVPAVIRESGAEFRWFASSDVGWPIGITLVHYELFAGTLLLCVLVLSTLPGVAPRGGMARLIHALGFGSLAATSQLYLSVIAGPVLVLLCGSLLAPVLERVFAKDSPP